jgi:hypothetical protein
LLVEGCAFGQDSDAVAVGFFENDMFQNTPFLYS